MEEILKNERKNKRTNERTNERTIIPKYREIFSSNIELGHILNIPNTHLCTINKRKCQKQFFQHISGIFGRKNMFFENQAQSHYRYYHFASVCKPHEKIWSTAREIQETPFFRRKSSLPAIFRKFRIQKSILLTI